MKNLLSFFIVTILFCGFTFFTEASEELPTNIRAFNTYLGKVDTNERVDVYGEIIDNIDMMIKEVNSSQKYSKLQKRKLLNQYRLYKSRTQIALKKEQKKAIVNIDFQRIIPKKTANSGTIVSTDTGSANTGIIYQQVTPQYQQNSPTTISVSTPATTIANNNSTQLVSPTTTNAVTQAQNPASSTPTYNPKIIIANSNITSPTYRKFDVSSSANTEIGRFSITASDQDFQIQSLTFSNIGSSNLSDFFTSNPNIQLIDIERGTNWSIDCGDIVEGNKILIQNCNIGTILKGTKRNFKLVMQPNNITNSINKTIQLSLSSSDFGLLRISDSGAIDTSKIEGSILSDIYTADYATPSVSIRVLGNNVNVLISNNSIFQTTIQSFTFEITQTSSNGQLKGYFCGQVEGNRNGCGIPGVSLEAVPISESSPVTTHIFTLPILNQSNNILSPNSTNSVLFPINIMKNSMIYAPNQVKVKIKQINYQINDINYTIDTSDWYGVASNLD